MENNASKAAISVEEIENFVRAAHERSGFTTFHLPVLLHRSGHFRSCCTILSADPSRRNQPNTTQYGSEQKENDLIPGDTVGRPFRRTYSFSFSCSAIFLTCHDNSPIHVGRGHVLSRIIGI